MRLGKGHGDSANNVLIWTLCSSKYIVNFFKTKANKVDYRMSAVDKVSPKRVIINTQCDFCF